MTVHASCPPKGCTPGSVVIAPACAGGVAWLRVIDPSKTTGAVTWVNTETGASQFTAPSGVVLGECEEAVAQAQSLVFVNEFDPNIAGAQFFPSSERITADTSLAGQPATLYVAEDGTTWEWNGVDQYEVLDQTTKVKVKNPTASPLAGFKVVYITGASGGAPEVAYASNDAEATSSKTIGVVQQDITGNSTGWVVEAGEVRGDTSAWPAGTALWLGTGGGLTSTKPTAPAHAVYVGTVLEQGANGRLAVRVQNGFEIGELHDVDAAGAVTGDVLVKNADGVWRPVHLIQDFSKVVYFNGLNPNSATVFSTDNPPTVHDPALVQDNDNLYVGSDGSTWTWGTTGYTTYVAPAQTAWYVAGTTLDAAGNKTGSIYRQGAVLLATGGSTETTPRKSLHVQAGGNSGVAGFGDGLLFSSSSNAGARVFLEHNTALAGQRLITIYHEAGLTRFGAILSDDGNTWVVQNPLVVRNNGGPIAGAVGFRNAAPVSHVDIGGSFGVAISKSTAANYPMTVVEHTFVSQQGNTTVTLPPPSADNARRKYVVKRDPAATGATAVLGHIDNVASQSLPVPAGQSRTFHSDGTTWWVI